MLRRGAAAGALPLALACSDADEPAPAPDARDTESAALASMAQPAMCELPSGGYAEDCNECLAAECCTPIEDCKSDADCSTQLTCIVECQHAADPSACSAGCTASSGVHAGYVAYDDCSFDRCLSTCWM